MDQYGIARVGIHRVGLVSSAGDSVAVIALIRLPPRAAAPSRAIASATGRASEVGNTAACPKVSSRWRKPTRT
jgi:hypothetical protein